MVSGSWVVGMVVLELLFVGVTVWVMIVVLRVLVPGSDKTDRLFSFSIARSNLDQDRRQVQTSCELYSFYVFLLLLSGNIFVF